MRRFETVAVCLLEAIFDLETVANAQLNNNGGHPLQNGAIRTDSDSVPKIIAEMVEVRNSERANRVIDHDREGCMELKKPEGYF
jgi:sulfate adenylyltransferase subunit 2